MNSPVLQNDRMSFSCFEKKMFLSYGERLILSSRTQAKRLYSIEGQQIICQQIGGHNNLTTDNKAKLSCILNDLTKLVTRSSRKHVPIIKNSNADSTACK
jgi:hypothetical protein